MKNYLRGCSGARLAEAGIHDRLIIIKDIKEIRRHPGGEANAWDVSPKEIDKGKLSAIRNRIKQGKKGIENEKSDETAALFERVSCIVQEIFGEENADRVITWEDGNTRSDQFSVPGVDTPEIHEFERRCAEIVGLEFWKEAPIYRGADKSPRTFYRLSNWKEEARRSEREYERARHCRAIALGVPEAEVDYDAGPILEAMLLPPYKLRNEIERARRMNELEGGIYSNPQNFWRGDTLFRHELDREAEDMVLARPEFVDDNLSAMEREDAIDFAINKIQPVLIQESGLGDMDEYLERRASKDPESRAFFIRHRIVRALGDTICQRRLDELGLSSDAQWKPHEIALMTIRLQAQERNPRIRKFIQDAWKKQKLPIPPQPSAPEFYLLTSSRKLTPDGRSLLGLINTFDDELIDFEIDFRTRGLADDAVSNRYDDLTKVWKKIDQMITSTGEEESYDTYVGTPSSGVVNGLIEIITRMKAGDRAHGMDFQTTCSFFYDLTLFVQRMKEWVEHTFSDEKKPHIEKKSDTESVMPEPLKTLKNAQAHQKQVAITWIDPYTKERMSIVGEIRVIVQEDTPYPLVFLHSHPHGIYFRDIVSLEIAGGEHDRRIALDTGDPVETEEMAALRRDCIEYSRALSFLDQAHGIIHEIPDRSQSLETSIDAYGLIALQEAKAGITSRAEQDCENAIELIQKYDRKNDVDVAGDLQGFFKTAVEGIVGVGRERLDVYVVSVIKAMVILGKREEARFLSQSGAASKRAFFEVLLELGYLADPIRQAEELAEDDVQKSNAFIARLSGREETRRFQDVIDNYQYLTEDLARTVDANRIVRLFADYEKILEVTQERGDAITPIIERMGGLAARIKGHGELKWPAGFVGSYRRHPYLFVACAYISDGQYDKAKETARAIGEMNARADALFVIAKKLAEKGYPVDDLILELQQHTIATKYRPVEIAVADIEVARGNFERAEELINAVKDIGYNKNKLYYRIAKKRYAMGMDPAPYLQKVAEMKDPRKVHYSRGEYPAESISAERNLVAAYLRIAEVNQACGRIDLCQDNLWQARSHTESLITWRSDPGDLLWRVFSAYVESAARIFDITRKNVVESIVKTGNIDDYMARAHSTKDRAFEEALAKIKTALELSI